MSVKVQLRWLRGAIEHCSIHKQRHGHWTATFGSKLKFNLSRHRDLSHFPHFTLALAKTHWNLHLGTHLSLHLFVLSCILPWFIETRLGGWTGLHLWLPGAQVQQVVCKKQTDHSVVYNHFCDKRSKPKEKRRSCNTEPCSPRWGLWKFDKSRDLS